MDNFLPEYIVLSLCHEFTIKPGDITRDRVIDQDARCVVFNRYIDQKLPGLSWRDRSLVMLIAFMSELAEPRDSVAEACKVYTDAVREEVIIPDADATENDRDPKRSRFGLVARAIADRGREIDRLQAEIGVLLTDVERSLDSSGKAGSTSVATTGLRERKRSRRALPSIEPNGG